VNITIILQVLGTAFILRRICNPAVIIPPDNGDIEGVVIHERVKLQCVPDVMSMSSSTDKKLTSSLDCLSERLRYNEGFTDPPRQLIVNLF